MKTVVITGSTRGIGLGLARAFAAQGCQVVIAGRSQQAVDARVAELSAEHPGRVAGAVCEVTDEAQLGGLWDAACQAFGRVDVWINNAGISIPRAPLHECAASDIQRIVSINLCGALLANQVVIQRMLQQGGGQVWTMEGFGSNGQTQPGMTAYGATKRAVHYMLKSLHKELKGTPVQVCSLSPGIVVTDLLIGDYDQTSPEWAKVKKIFNILGDRVETVTPWLAQQVLATNKSGAKVAWLTSGKAFGRFMTAGFKKRDLFAQEAH